MIRSINRRPLGSSSCRQFMTLVQQNHRTLKTMRQDSTKASKDVYNTFSIEMVVSWDLMSLSDQRSQVVSSSATSTEFNKLLFIIPAPWDRSLRTLWSPRCEFSKCLKKMSFLMASWTKKMRWLLSFVYSGKAVTYVGFIPTNSSNSFQQKMGVSPK